MTKTLTTRLMHILRTELFRVFFCRNSNTPEIQYLYWKNSIGCLSVNWLTFRQDKRKLHDSPSPPLQSLLSTFLPNRTGGRTGVREYADIITKFSRIDRFPFSKAVEASPRALRAREAPTLDTHFESPLEKLFSCHRRKKRFFSDQFAVII